MSEASQENFEKKVFLTTKYEQIVKIRTFAMPKSGGGGAQTHLCPPHTFERREARGPPFSYALDLFYSSPMEPKFFYRT